MNQNLALLVRMIFGFLDLLVLNTIFFLMKWYFVETAALTTHQEYYPLWITANLGWLICAGMHRLYDPATTNSFEAFVSRTFQTYIFFLILTLTYLYFARQLYISRIFVSAFIVAFPLSLLLNRMFYLITWMRFKHTELVVKRVMIIGYNELGKKIATYLEKNNTQMKLVGYCEDYKNIKELSNYPILDTLSNALIASREYRISEIYSTILPEHDHRIYDLMQSADQACIRFKLVPDLGIYVNRPMHLNYVSGMPILSARTEPLEDITNRIRKRLFDIVFASFAVIFVLSWLFPLIALFIWLESRGPIFFVQKRSGLNNEPFNCIKFRSMKVNQHANLVQASRDDERFTRVGRFLRKTNLDEFPQFINVLKGEMSIVGPRPHMLKHTEDYSAIISRYMIRQFVKPGITGWAQVRGFRGETRRIEDMEGRVNHDIWYMENWSLLLDLKIIVLTGYNIFKGDKNAF
ncbi:undecaprenyl-phosphate glucose phosphotransferase [Flavitalea antarctica]